MVKLVTETSRENKVVCCFLRQLKLVHEATRSRLSFFWPKLCSLANQLGLANTLKLHYGINKLGLTKNWVAKNKPGKKCSKISLHRDTRGTPLG
jgi:hypothetical protein